MKQVNNFSLNIIDDYRYQKMEDMKKEMRRLRIEEKMLLLQQLEAENNRHNVKPKPIRRRKKTKSSKSSSALELLPASDTELDNGSLILVSDAFQNDAHSEDEFFELSPDKPTRSSVDNDDSSELDIEKISHRSGLNDAMPDEVSQQYQHPSPHHHDHADDVSPISNFTDDLKASDAITAYRNTFSPPKPR